MPLLGHCPQRTRRCLGIKRNPGLLQNPRFNLFVVHAQQVEGAANVILLTHALGRMALNLSLIHI